MIFLIYGAFTTESLAAVLSIFLGWKNKWIAHVGTGTKHRLHNYTRAFLLKTQRQLSEGGCYDRLLRSVHTPSISRLGVVGRRQLQVAGAGLGSGRAYRGRDAARGGGDGGDADGAAVAEVTGS